MNGVLRACILTEVTASTEGRNCCEPSALMRMEPGEGTGAVHQCAQSDVTCA